MEMVIHPNVPYQTEALIDRVRRQNNLKRSLLNRLANVLSERLVAQKTNFVDINFPNLKKHEAAIIGQILNRRNFGGTSQKIVMTRHFNIYKITFIIDNEKAKDMEQEKVDPRRKTFDELPPEVRRRKELANNISTLLRIRDKGYDAIESVILPRQKEFMANYKEASTKEIDEVIENLRNELHYPSQPLG